MFSEKGVLRELDKVRDGESTIAGGQAVYCGFLSGVGRCRAIQPLPYPRGVLSTGCQLRRGESCWEWDPAPQPQT